jgi:hypothetical protein
METAANAELIPLLSSADAEIRTVALHWLSEGYAMEPEICQSVWRVWDERGIAAGFPEFPMLSHFPIPAVAIEECCQRSMSMVEGVTLTSTESRAAGKLIEQVTRLSPAELVPRVELLRRTVARSKIFFRVDVPGVQARIDLLELDADGLAGRLDQAIESLTQQRTDVKAVQRGLNALEALRRGYPNYLDLGAVLAETPPDDGPHAISFQLAMQSLVHFGQVGLEAAISRHVLDRREAVYLTAIDALVRAGTPAAADGLLQAFPQADSANRQWIARGLQRLRVKGLADRIASLRAITQDARLWLMLLVAEIRQMDLEHAGWLAADIGRVHGHSYALVNAMTMYNCVHAGANELQLLQSAFVQYLARTHQSLLEERADKEQELKKVEAQQRKKREQARAAVLKRFREEK